MYGRLAILRPFQKYLSYQEGGRLIMKSCMQVNPANDLRLQRFRYLGPLDQKPSALPTELPVLSVLSVLDTVKCNAAVCMLSIYLDQC